MDEATDLDGYRVFCSNFGLLIRHQRCGEDLGILPSGSGFADLFAAGKRHRCLASTIMEVSEEPV